MLAEEVDEPELTGTLTAQREDRWAAVISKGQGEAGAEGECEVRCQEGASFDARLKRKLGRRGSRSGRRVVEQPGPAANREVGVRTTREVIPSCHADVEVAGRRVVVVRGVAETEDGLQVEHRLVINELAPGHERGEPLDGTDADAALPDRGHRCGVWRRCHRRRRWRLSLREGGRGRAECEASEERQE